MSPEDVMAHEARMFGAVEMLDAAVLPDATVVTYRATSGGREQRARWGESFDLAARAFVEAGVELTLVPWCEERVA